MGDTGGNGPAVGDASDGEELAVGDMGAIDAQKERLGSALFDNVIWYFYHLIHSSARVLMHEFHLAKQRRFEGATNLQPYNELPHYGLPESIIKIGLE